MRDHGPNRAQVSTLFGTACASESHGSGLVRDERNKRRTDSPFAVAFLLMLLVASTAAAAITSWYRTDPPMPELWLQNQPSILSKLPGSAAFDDLLF